MKQMIVISHKTKLLDGFHRLFEKIIIQSGAGEFEIVAVENGIKIKDSSGKITTLKITTLTEELIRIQKEKVK